MSRPFIFFLLFLVLAITAVGFWYWQGNQYSKEILKLEILSSADAEAGQEVDYLVKFKNNGKVRLENPELIFEYPDQAFPLDDKPQRITKQLDDIYPGEEKVITFPARVFGKKGDTLEARAWLSYTPKGLKAAYESETSFTTQIKTTPITLEFDLPLKTEQDETLQFSINYFSNIDYVLDNLRLKVQYPNGFTFVSSQPSALDETEWSLPALFKVDGGRVGIQGVVQGAEGEKKLFVAQLGVVRNNQFILLKQVSQAVEITEPMMYISQLINGQQNYIANVNELLHYELFFKNIGKKPIQKKFLFAKLEGDFFDLGSLKSENGEVGRGDNSIIWDWKNVPDLRFLNAGEEGKVEFWVKTIEPKRVKKMENPLLRDKITIGGTLKVFDNKINSKVDLAQRAYFEEEVFGNSGPLPPQVNASTTYTIFWQVKNSWNALENAKVRAVLPQNVKLTGKIFPEDAKLTFDAMSREVVWNIGDLKAFQGSDIEKPLTLAFQVELTPNKSQENKIVQIIGEAEFLATDAFTSEIIQEKSKLIDTSLPDDKTMTPEKIQVSGGNG